VRGHVIAAFEGVRIGWITLWNKSVNKIVEILPDRRIRNFIQSQCSGSMFQMNMQKAGFRQFIKITCNLPGDQMKTSAKGAQRNFFLNYHGTKKVWNMWYRLPFIKINQKDCSFALFNILTIFERLV
jgi:hypothetical protein